MIGVAGGFMMAGLIIGAITGSAWLLIGFVCIGMLIAGVSSIITSYNNKATASCKLAQYPPYGY